MAHCAFSAATGCSPFLHLKWHIYLIEEKLKVVLILLTFRVGFRVIFLGSNNRQV